MNDVASKVVDRSQLKRLIADWRNAGHPIILANGCFDVLHVGHIRYLQAAKKLGGKLIVALNADKTVRQLKGADRPRVPEQERAEIIAALADVDAVVVFTEPDVTELVREIRPTIHAKGTDYTVESVPERDTVVECGGRVEIVGDPKDHSSSSMLRAWKKS